MMKNMLIKNKTLLNIFSKMFRAKIPLKECNLIKSNFYSNFNYILVYEQIKKGIQTLILDHL